MAALIPLIVSASLFLLVLGIGLQSRLSDVGYVLSHPALLVRGFIAVNIVVPAAMVLMCLALPIARMTEAGLVLMAVSPMAPFVVGKMLKTGSDRAYDVGLYVALILASVVVVPLTIVALNAAFSVKLMLPVADLAIFVAKSVLIPIAIGLGIGTLWPEFGRRSAPIVTLVAYVALVPVALLMLWSESSLLAGLIGDGTFLASVVTIIVGIAAGHYLGGPLPEHRLALAQAAATRHPGIAGLIAHKSFNDPSVTLAIILFLLISIVVSKAYGQLALRKFARQAGNAPGE